ncbi:hypothetical protein PINS_up005808 [Pythium insidiosum]|nr:hypothetical protein PINS_up005808 [Pythium insidiosum]
MGQVDVDENVEQPVVEDGLDQDDVEVKVTLKLSLSQPSAVVAAAQEQSNGDDGETDPGIAMCQICMEFYGAKEVVRSICGPECLAEVCPTCVVQHLTATVYSFYPGVLPKMRCPVCLTLLNKNQWVNFVMPPSTEGDEQADTEAKNDGWTADNSHVLEKFKVLCQQSCGFQAPCCHNAEYTMLPHVPPDVMDEPLEEIALPASQAAFTAELEGMFESFCYHQTEVAAFYDFIVKSFPGNEQSILELVLSRIEDDERRAALLLHHLFRNPNTYTTCCDYTVCFKCKAAKHHDGNCNDFIEDESVLDCPGCHVTLVKVDGCDSVACLCGYTIDWPIEIEKQRLQRKQLAPSDEAIFQHWHRWARRLDSCLDRIDELEMTWRQIRLDRMIRMHKSSLRVLLHRARRRAEINIWIDDHRHALVKLVRRRKQCQDQSEPAAEATPVHPPIAPAA